MRNKLALIRSRVDGTALQREIDEELQFHVDMCAREYQSQGLSTEDSLQLATQRFGDFSAVRRQCIQISSQKKAHGKTMSAVCALILLLGISVRMSTSDFQIARIGQVLIMIALTGALLTLVKKLSALHLVSDKEVVRLGLNNSEWASHEESDV